MIMDAANRLGLVLVVLVPIEIRLEQKSLLPAGDNKQQQRKRRTQ
jgi:hypothetical protein